MRNIAKCKLCHSIIESFHNTDYVTCKCGHISVDGGEAMRCAAIDFANFLRVDDEGNEIVVKVKEEKKMGKEEILEELANLIKKYEDLPTHLIHSPITHYDLLTVLILVHAILKCKD